MKRETSWNVKEEGPSRGIEAVTFDVGGTLIEPWPSVGHVYAQVAAEHGAGNCSPEVLNRQFAAAWRKRKNFRHSRPEWSAVVDAAFAGLTDVLPSRTFFPHLYTAFARADAWRIFPDVLPALEALRARGLPLGIISNWDERLRPLLQALKLDHFFEDIVVSCEARTIKPDRRIFDVACRELRLPPASVLHVGDSDEMDVRGARGAGMQALQIQRSPAQVGPGQIATLLSPLLVEPPPGNAAGLAG